MTAGWRKRSGVAAELRWPGRASVSPTTGGGAEEVRRGP
jgi:hypothetical protein